MNQSVGLFKATLPIRSTENAYIIIVIIIIIITNRFV